MSLNNKTVHDIARLARLEIETSEVEKYRDELTNILDLVAQMEAVDTTDVAPMTHPFDATLRLRDDAVSESNNREKFQSIAPNAQDGLYLVPKVID